jgi:hypothetical protein
MISLWHVAHVALARPGGQFALKMAHAAHIECLCKHSARAQIAACRVVDQSVVLHKIPVEVSPDVDAALRLVVRLKKPHRLHVRQKLAQYEGCNTLQEGVLNLDHAYVKDRFQTTYWMTVLQFRDWDYELDATANCSAELGVPSLAALS